MPVTKEDREKIAKIQQRVSSAISGISSPINNTDIIESVNNIPDAAGKIEIYTYRLDTNNPTFSKWGTIDGSKKCIKCKIVNEEEINWHLPTLYENICKLIVEPILIPITKAIVFDEKFFKDWLDDVEARMLIMRKDLDKAQDDISEHERRLTDLEYRVRGLEGRADDNDLRVSNTNGNLDDVLIRLKNIDEDLVVIKEELGL